MVSLWIFPAPEEIVVTCHHMWSGTISSTTMGGPRRSMMLCEDGGPVVCVRPPWPRSGPGRVGHSLGPPNGDGELE